MPDASTAVSNLSNTSGSSPDLTGYLDFMAGGAFGAIGQDANGNWTSTTYDNNNNAQTSNLQDLMTPDQWTTFQNGLKQGYITTQGGSQGNILDLTNKLPPVDGMSMNQLEMADNMGQGIIFLGDGKTAPTQYGGRNLIDPNAVAYDPNWGYTTSMKNVQSDDDWMDKAGSFIGDIAPAAIMAAGMAATMNPEMLAGEGSLIGAGSMYDTFGNLGGQVFNQVGNALEGNKPSLSNIVGDIAGIAGNIPGVGDITNQVGELIKQFGPIAQWTPAVVNAIVSKNPMALANPALSQLLHSITSQGS